MKMLTWQPIETAPKDGTEILASDGQNVVACSWQGDTWSAFNWKGSDIPKYWMPFPPAPKPKPQLHRFVPDRKYPWFCAECGYAPHEVLKHIQE